MHGIKLNSDLRIMHFLNNKSKTFANLLVAIVTAKCWSVSPVPLVSITAISLYRTSEAAKVNLFL